MSPVEVFGYNACLAYEVSYGKADQPSPWYSTALVVTYPAVAAVPLRAPSQYPI